MLRLRLTWLIIGALAPLTQLRVGRGVMAVAPAHAQFSPEGRKRTRPPASKAKSTEPGARTEPPAPRSPAPNRAPRALTDGLYTALLENPGEPAILTKVIETARELDPELHELSKRLRTEVERADKLRASAAMIALGRLERARGNSEGARDWFQRATRSAPERMHSYMALAELVSESDALALLDAALAQVSGPDRAKLFERLRSLAVTAGDDARALRYQAEIARLDRKRSAELGELYLERGEALKAARAFEAAIAQAVSPERRVLWLGLARAVVASKELDRAATALQQARSEKGDASLLDEILLYEMDVAQARGALVEFAAKRVEGTRDLRVLGRLAQGLEASSEPARALEVRKKMLVLAPREVEVWRGYAELLERGGNLREAKEAYRSLLAVAPGDARAWQRVLEMTLALGGAGSMARDLELALSLVQTVEEKLAILDLCETALDALACERLERKLVVQSRERALLYELGRRRFTAGDAAGARAAWVKGRGASPDGEAWSQYADLLIDHELVEEGLMAHERARSLAPGDPKIRRARALALERALSAVEGKGPEGRRASALAAWLDLATDMKLKSREREEAARHVVRLWQRASVIESETERLRRRYEEVPTDRANADLYVAALVVLGRRDDATQVLEVLARAAPFDPSLRIRLLGPRGGESSGGSLDMLAVVERTTLERSLREAATEALARGKNQEALAALDRLHKLVPADAKVLLLRADALERLGRRDEAAQSVEAAARLAPRSAAVSLRKAALLVREGRSREAAQLYLNVLRSPAGPEELAEASDALLLLRAKEGSEGFSVLLAVEESTVRAFSARPGHPGYRALLLALYDSMFLSQALPKVPEGEEGLVRARERARMPLLTILSGGSETERAHAARLLVRIGGKESGHALLDYALSGAPSDLACSLIEDLGLREDDETVRALTDAAALEDWTPRIRMSLTFALARSRSEKVVPTLLSLARSGSTPIQTLAWLGLGPRHIEPASAPRPPSASSLVQASRRLALGDFEFAPGERESSSALIRGAALLSRALRAVSEGASLVADPEMRSEFAHALVDPDWVIRGAALRGLELFGGSSFSSWLPESSCRSPFDPEEWVERLLTRGEAPELIPWEAILPEITQALTARLRGPKADQVAALDLLAESPTSPNLSLPVPLRGALRRALSDQIDDIIARGDELLQSRALSAASFPGQGKSAARERLRAILFGQEPQLARLVAELILAEGDGEGFGWLEESLSKASSWSLRRSILQRGRERPSPSPELREFLRRSAR